MSTNEYWDDMLLNPQRRSFLKTAAAGGAVAAAGGLAGLTLGSKEARAHAYEPYPTDDQLETVVTSCDHNCGSRHMLVAHKKGDVIVRLSTDDGRYQAGGAFGHETEQVPQVFDLDADPAEQNDLGRQKLADELRAKWTEVDRALPDFPAPRRGKRRY